MELADIIKGCKKKDRKSQKCLYDRYSALLFSICRRYFQSNEEAEDALLEGMYKIFSRIEDFKEKGSFEGWMKRIVINECLMHLRKRKNFSMKLEISRIEIKNKITVEDELAYQEIILLLDNLPTGYRTVFNLYVIEGYKHREIAEKLGISINTSKSQLILARKRLREMIKKKHKRIAI